ncbi:type IV pili twitching motility protein PilT [Candidatus Uhrbacteria bacterium CG_4_10_14_0_2_um_filter_41_7]|uniref:Type IV pili twitching motility protein PilT n=1 Tax=Candidatus Uhrbacteria bacterium CG_4_9_14_3_um_filter_41_35 TaxID=1975034 RepID=A0A2M7XFW6_9BACT|nr:MAG: type IV pili twitching motility protein PilT [Candidatus Uhrbacteria bacterium CG_4_10_14_0_2_um_filter_41_7]PJA46626.1 MAG: type IV pili twitching motility protein PilT [Candidatus Uhrbacteria bacterium CG_4_9_14_3_um_filter_41_35]
MEEFKKILLLALKKGASDIHLVVGSAPYFRIEGELTVIDKPIFTQVEAKNILGKILNAEQKSRLVKTGDVDTGLEVSKTFLRINAHKQSGGFGLSIRIFANEPPTPEEIELDQQILDIVGELSGLVILSGPAGTGKSTTLATMIQHINETDKQHIITLEDPIEYRFQKGNSLIEQRELGTDFQTFASGLRHVLRQDPNVIVIGEMRDPETIELALTAAETGHLVLSTLHSPNATEVVERIVGVFEGAKQQQILIQLSAALKMVVSQHLVMKKDGTRMAAREILTSTSAVRNAIRNNKLSTIRSAIETGRKFGMISMKQVLEQLQADGIIE